MWTPACGAVQGLWTGSRCEGQGTGRGRGGEPEISPSAARLALACAPSPGLVPAPSPQARGTGSPGAERSTTDGETQHSRKGFSHGSGGRVSKIKVSAGLYPSEGGGRAPPGLSPSFWGPQASLGAPSHADASLGLCLRLRSASRCVRLSSYKDTSHWTGAHSAPV